MRRFAIALLIASGLFVGHAQAESRCGWIVNPTPGNWWLTDSQDSWIIATQGDDRDPGMEHVPDIGAHDYVKTNGLYGYACGCMAGDYDANKKIVVKIVSFVQKPLAACRKDKKLKSPD